MTTTEEEAAGQGLKMDANLDEVVTERKSDDGKSTYKSYKYDLSGGRDGSQLFKPFSIWLTWLKLTVLI